MIVATTLARSDSLMPRMFSTASAARTTVATTAVGRETNSLR
jgi:hypothetical protein